MIGEDDAGRERDDETSLPADEANELRRQIRHRLESEFLRVGPGLSQGISPVEPMDGSRAAALRAERRRILREEEDAFYAERGLYRYRNHRGEYEWLSKEDIERRRSRRRNVDTGWRTTVRSLARNSLVRDIGNGLIVFGVIAAIIILFRREKPSTEVVANADYGIMVRSEPTGAAIFVDGRAAGWTTNVRIAMGEPGRHVVRVVLPGYRTVPDSHVVQLARSGETVQIAFTLYGRAGGAVSTGDGSPSTGTTGLMIDTARSTR